MTKTTKAALAASAVAIAAPTTLEHGVTEPAVARNLRVVDANTDEEIAGVISADAEAGRVRRHRIEGGNLVREGDAYASVDEERAVRIEWIEAPVAEVDGDAEDAG